MTIQLLIEKIRTSAKQWSETLEPEANDSELDNFTKEVLLKYSISLPEEYINFLKVINGLEFNGLIIYGTKNSEIDPDGSPLDLIEMNEIMKNTLDKQLGVVVIGEDSTGLITYDNNSKQFQYRDRIGIDRVQSFSSFEDMFEVEVNKVL